MFQLLVAVCYVRQGMLKRLRHLPQWQVTFPPSFSEEYTPFPREAGKVFRHSPLRAA